MIVIGDSIIKNLDPIEGVQLKAFPGATIGKLGYLINSREIKWANYQYVIIHVGTNNVANKNTISSILSDFGNLIANIRKLNPHIRIIVSSILPRPVDHTLTDSIIRNINVQLEKSLSKTLNFKFVKSYRPFCRAGAVQRCLFARLDGGLHLNLAGSSTLRHFFVRVISTL